MIVIEIASQHIVETLDILVNSIIEPLITSNTISDQIQLIDSESQIAKSNDYYRICRLLAHIAKDHHPLGQFSWGRSFSKATYIKMNKSDGYFLGDRESLKNLIINQDSVNFLQHWISDQYCIPEGMNLVMMSNGDKSIYYSIDGFHCGYLFFTCTQIHIRLCSNASKKYSV